MFEFDVDRSVTAEGPGVYRGKITERWNIGPVPNGGYLLAVAMAALEQELAGLSPPSGSVIAGSRQPVACFSIDR